jgi:hypothetical protein
MPRVAQVPRSAFQIGPRLRRIGVGGWLWRPPRPLSQCGVRRTPPLQRLSQATEWSEKLRGWPASLGCADQHTCPQGTAREVDLGSRHPRLAPCAMSGAGRSAVTRSSLAVGVQAAVCLSACLAVNAGCGWLARLSINFVPHPCHPTGQPAGSGRPPPGGRIGSRGDVRRL